MTPDGRYTSEEIAAMLEADARGLREQLTEAEMKAQTAFYEVCHRERDLGGAIVEGTGAEWKAAQLAANRARADYYEAIRLVRSLEKHMASIGVIR